MKRYERLFLNTIYGVGIAGIITMLILGTVWFRLLYMFH